jgi:tetratricopeptide (TPR) repeat protein
MNSRSVLAPYFMGIVFERTGRANEAISQYTRAWQLSPECYPAALALFRVMDAQGQKQEALRLLQDLVIRFPDNFQIKRQMALAWYNNRDWSRAEPAIAEILQRDSRDGEFILMRAHVLVEQGQYLQAQAPLDLYASINPGNSLYLFLRARVQAEGYHNRDAALNYLRSLLRNSPDDEASVYAARLLMESTRSEDQREGRDLLTRLLSAPRPSLIVVSLALQDAIRREAWQEARSYLGRLLDERRSSQDLFYAYTVEHGQGNNATALSYARELYERDPSNEDGILAYISALIDTGRQSEAGRMIESRLSTLAGGVLKGRYYYLRSRIRANEDLVMNDLRSSLFEDPRNLNALIGMFEIYHRRRDERRAVYYLKQALALAPDNPQLKRYEAEYAGAL